MQKKVSRHFFITWLICNAYIITGSTYGGYENHSWIKKLFDIIKKIVEFKIPLLTENLAFKNGKYFALQNFLKT